MATVDRSVRGVFSPDELEEAIQLAAAQSVDSDFDTHIHISWRRLKSMTNVQGATGPVRSRQAEEKSTDLVRGELVTADR